MSEQNIRELALNRLCDERDRQDAQWGGPAHDDTHELADWFEFIGRQLKAADHQLSYANGNAEARATMPSVAVDRLAKIGALAVAAIESITRKHGA